MDFQDIVDVLLCHDRVVEMCKTFQTTARDMSERYYSRLRRHNYVTPTSYLELILTFKSLLNVKRTEVAKAKERYVVGLEKLEFATSQVTHHPGQHCTEYYTKYCLRSSFFLNNLLFLSTGISDAGRAYSLAAGAHPDLS